MYQTGVKGTGSLRQAWMKGDFPERTVTSGIVSHGCTSGIVWLHVRDRFMAERGHRLETRRLRSHELAGQHVTIGGNLY
jgi:hypothetical protein